MPDAIKEAVKDIKFYLDRIEALDKRNKQLEAALRKIEKKYWYPSTAEIARAALGEKKDV